MHVCQHLRQVRASACDATAAGGIIGVPDIRFERQADGMSWDQAVRTVTPHIVKIETPDGYGTGFL
ncbi:MAG TPA: hypothetical protein VKB72_03325, partial [Steroidobacteraceae bacterium]|nr:hypothetical protein [Steroidobacteraceae bacterium]